MARPSFGEPEVGALLGDVLTLTTTTPGLVVARNRPAMAIGIEVISLFATGVSTPTWNLTPRLRQAWHFDDSLGKYNDITAALRDRFTAAADISSAEGAADPYKDFIYLCCNVPFTGVYVDITNANGTASVLNALYPTAQDVWTGFTETDGTAAAGATLAQDAPLTWTMPTDWVVTAEGPVGNKLAGYWARLGFTATLDASVSIANLTPLPVQTIGGKIAQGAATADAVRALSPRPYFFNPEEVGGVMAAGVTTETIRVTWLCRQDRGALVAE